MFKKLFFPLIALIFGTAAFFKYLQKAILTQDCFAHLDPVKRKLAWWMVIYKADHKMYDTPFRDMSLDQKNQCLLDEYNRL